MDFFSQQGHSDAKAEHPYWQLMTGIADALDEVLGNDQVQTASLPRTQTPAQIINQITEYIRISSRDDLSSMEMQLHPATLGTVKIMVQQAQNGELTARFTAQSEAVKNALQSQIVQLQQRLDEQGLKVNAVEVTVDTHAFEQNLEQNQQQNNDAADQQNRQSRVRRINLGDLDLNMEETGELDESTRIAAEMMAANGNQVDYQA
jgi:flagellar hook-length control protein FliK